MFKYEGDNQKVGAYLKTLIEKQYPSHRQFCKAYLTNINVEPSNEELRKQSNRLSQILQGKKAIQTYDLPVFTKLLGVSCEEILSCGKTFVPVSGHITNYEVAFSRDPEVWEAYIKRPDKLILNADEYNKTVIDYAIEFKNYPFIQYLIDRGDIWFVDNSETDNKDFCFGFSAGTRIKRRGPGEIDAVLGIELQFECEQKGLRQSVIALAMENKDYGVLDSFKAREIPTLYQFCCYTGTPQTKCMDYYNEDVITEIAKSDGKVLEYFSEEFPIRDHQGEAYGFIYPFLNKVIEALINEKSKYTQAVLRKAIEHNQKVYHTMSSMKKNAVDYVLNDDSDWIKDQPERIRNEIIQNDSMKLFRFINEDGLVSCLFPAGKYRHDKICSNVVRTDAVSGDFLLDSLIRELNRLYDAVKNIEFEIMEHKEVTQNEQSLV